jgi:hypothetical protein
LSFRENLLDESPVPRYRKRARTSLPADTREWAAGIAFTSFGSRIGVRVDDPALLAPVRDYLPPGWRRARSPLVDYLYSITSPDRTTTSDGSARYQLILGSHLHTEAPDLPTILQQLGSNLDFTVGLTARKQLFVHAGVVGWCGRAIVIPGSSRSGKTSLVAALVRAGAAYYSDEYAVIDASGRVLPYPRPLSIRTADGRSTHRCPVQVLGGKPGTRPLPVGLVVATEYRSGSRWRPRRLSPGETVLALMQHTVLARYRSGMALPRLQLATNGVLALKGKREEAESVVPALLDHVSRIQKAARVGRLPASGRK